MIDKTTEILMVYVAWVLVTIAYSVPVATITLMLVGIVEVIVLVKYPEKVFSEDNYLKSTFLSNLVTVTVSLWIAISTYPYGWVFWAYIALEIINNSVYRTQERKYRG